jgi:hypothetical protein
MPRLFDIAKFHHRPYIHKCIKSRADALANLPDPARWFPQGDAAKDGN